MLGLVMMQMHPLMYATTCSTMLMALVVQQPACQNIITDRSFDKYDTVLQVNGEKDFVAADIMFQVVLSTKTRFKSHQVKIKM